MTSQTNSLYDQIEDYDEQVYSLIESYFEGNHTERLVRHQIESYNDFVNIQIQKTIQMFNPVRIKSDNDFVKEKGHHILEIVIQFGNMKMHPPTIHENNGATKRMMPQEAKIRNITYASNMTVDMDVQYIVRNTDNMEEPRYIEKKIPSISIGKMPIMLKSCICELSNNRIQNTGECKMDCGGYFIIKGSEKTVLGQERTAENKIYCFDGKNTTKWSWMAEIKSVPDYKCISPKQVEMMISNKSNGFGHGIYVHIPRVKIPIELFTLFRALGLQSDREICSHIVLDVDAPLVAPVMDFLVGSIVDGSKYMTQEDAIAHIVSNVSYIPMNMDKETGARKKREFTNEVLNNDLFPHCGSMKQKMYLLGYMANKLICTSFKWRPQDDRDSYLNKRIELTGTLLNNLFRNYFNKLVKEMQKLVLREVNTSSWRSTQEYADIINMTNIYKIVKPATIENGINRALATGDFSIKQMNSTKVGVAQVLNRLTYPATLSHMRRINTPLEKCGELIPPRKLHNTTWGFLCPVETPEGQSIGVVKNISYLTHITIPCNSSGLYQFVAPFVKPVDTTPCKELFQKVKVIVNGCWLGVADDPMALYRDMKDKKSRGIISIYTSIVFNFKMMEIVLCSDGGRLMRPLLRVISNATSETVISNAVISETVISETTSETVISETVSATVTNPVTNPTEGMESDTVDRLLVTNDIIRRLRERELVWNDLFIEGHLDQAIMEYIDPDEQNTAMIAMQSKGALGSKRSDSRRYTHAEIHPSTIFGILASCIPFPEHNQAPRNTYQTAMGKQAMGIYATNYEKRMDKTGYVLTYPSRPLVDTRLMNFIELNRIPSGCQIHVAIMTHTGYNQEDSVLINKGALDRGLFVATIFHTEKDEDKNLVRDEIIRCKPDPAKTRGMKFGNYDKLDAKGFIPKDTRVENRDIIIAKMTPIKENRNDPTKVTKYEDQSKVFRTTEETYVDKNITGRNGEGYNFAKVRTRTFRPPVIGDKFACALPTQQVLTDCGWVPFAHLDPEQHKVATLDKRGNLAYEFPTEKFEYDYDGLMYSVATEDIEICCTPNHQLYCRDSNEPSSGPAFGFMQASTVFGTAVQMQRDMPNAYPDYVPGSNGTVQDMDVWLENLAVLLNLSLASADWLSGVANCSKQDCARPYRRMIRAMETEGVQTEYAEMPDYVWQMSQRQCRILLSGILGASNTCYTDSTVYADDLCRLAVHCGYSAEVKVAAVNFGRSTYSVCVDFIQAHLKPVKEANCYSEKWLHYIGKVYCVSMPSTHLYYFRENSFAPPMLSGNSRSAQKGTLGNIVEECDMPFTASGMRPDLILNPHAIPSRMTIAQLKETLLGKVLVELGMFGDGTAFNDFSIESIRQELMKLGYESHGNEIMYNGCNGKQLEVSVFIGPVFYQRLKHMVLDKQHSRAVGPMVNLTRQPAEGRCRDGGFRIGEMERDVMIAHGMSQFCKERLYDVSDKYAMWVCNTCGMTASFNDGSMKTPDCLEGMTVHHCRTCDNRTNFARVEVPYTYKLLTQELQTINVVPRFITEAI